VPVVSDPSTTNQELDYYPLWKEGQYWEKQTEKAFNFTYIVGLPYFLRGYRTDPDRGVIGGTRSLTTEEFALVREARKKILEKYRKPLILPEPKNLQLLLLKKYQEANLPSSVTINSILWSRYIYRLRWIHRLDDDRVPPYKLSAYLEQAFENKEESYNHKINHSVWYNLSTYILYRFEDWVESGGNRLFEEKKGPPFWIDLWDPEAIKCAEDRTADNHPRAQLKRKWDSDYWEWEKAEKRARAISILSEKGVTAGKLKEYYLASHKKRKVLV
jgi:hypothetical protein